MSDRALHDELEIRNLVARYSDAVSRRDASTWGDTWAEDGVWTLGAHAATGREAIVRLWTGLMGAFRSVSQHPTTGTVEVTGDEGRGRWHVLELGWPKAGAPLLTVGVYEDRYRRDEPGWRFAARHFRVVYTGSTDGTGRLLGDSAAPAGD